MKAWVRESKAGKSLFAITVLLALSLRILIPTGFMPTVSPQGLVVELCSGVYGKTVTIDLGKKLPGETQKHAADSPCVFAAGLRIFDIRDPSQPGEIGYFNHGVPVHGGVGHYDASRKLIYFSDAGGFKVLQLAPRVRARLGL